MKKGTILFMSVLLLGLSLLFLQPLHLISADSVRTTIHIGKTVPVTSITEIAGGYRCYVNDSEYFWVSAGESKKQIGDEQAVEFNLKGPTIIHMEAH